MSARDDGGSAFAQPAVYDNGRDQVNQASLYGCDTGMSLRDYFAAKAMHAIYMRLGGSPCAGNDHDGCLTHAAESAYAMADAMLKARAA